MIEKKGNFDSREAQQVRRQSEFLKRVHDFAAYMHKEYIAESDGEMSLLINASDGTLGDDKVGRMQCVMGSEALVVTGLASLMEQGENRELFRAARRMADDYDDLPQRRKELRRQRRVLYVLSGATVLWACAIILLRVFGIVDWINTISNSILTAFVGLHLWSFGIDLRHKTARLREDESDHAHYVADRKLEEIMRQFINKFRREQDDDEE